MATRLGAVAFTVLWCEWSTNMLSTPCTDVQGWVSNTIARAFRWPYMVTHRGTSGRAISFYSMPWPAPYAVHHWGCRLASLRRGSSNPGWIWAPKPYVHLPVQRLALGSPLQRSSRGRAATCLHEKARLARGHGSLSLGTYDAQTSCIPLKCYKIAYLFCEMHISFLRGQ